MPWGHCWLSMGRLQWSELVQGRPSGVLSGCYWFLGPMSWCAS